MSNKNASIAKGIFIFFLLVLVIMLFSTQTVHAAEQSERVNVDGSGSGMFCCKFWWSFHLGLTINNYDAFKVISYNIIINFEYRCWMYWAFVAEFGYNNFSLDQDETGISGDFYWWNINTTLRRYFGKDGFRPFISVGPGLYAPEFGTPRLGIKAGVGIDLKVSDRLIIEFGSDFHHIFMKEEDVFLLMTDRKFWFHAHGGIVIKIK